MSQLEAREQQRRELRTLGRSSFAGYASIMRPKYRPYPHLAPLEALIEDIAYGRVTRAIVSMPPRHGKSYDFSETAPPWIFGREGGSFKMMQGAYGSNLAKDFGRKVRNQMQHPLYRQVFDFGLSPDVTAADDFGTSNDGTYIAGGINSGFVGKGANWFNIDDPIKHRKEAESPTYRQGVIDWLQSVVYDRLETFDDGREPILTMCLTRWHVEDLAGWALKHLRDEGWIYLAMPAVADANGVRCSPTDPGAIPLFPEKYSLERYERIRHVVGSYEWDSKYQQNPTPATGGVINLEWFTRRGERARVAKRVQSWDTAQKQTVTSAYSTCGTFDVAAGRYHLADMYREKLKYPELKRAAKDLAERERPDAILIEDKASGIQLIQDLRAETSLPVIPVNPEADKVTRAYTQSALIEAGLVSLPHQAKWLPAFESEVRAFPAGDFADQVDVLTQFLAWQRNKGDSMAFASTGPRDSAGIGVSGGGFASTG